MIWDDVASTVEGTHSDVPGMRKTLARPTPVNHSSDERVLYLHNPAHDPADFLWLIGTAFSGILYEPPRSTLPPVFDGVELSSTEPAPPAVSDADGNLTGYLENGEPIRFGTCHGI